MADNPLGQDTGYPRQYAPELLFPVQRQDNRGALGYSVDELPFSGCDLWRAYEVSWLNGQGLPRVAIGEFLVPCDSRALVESKSLKLYLNSLNNERLGDTADVAARIASDLEKVTGAPVKVSLRAVDDMPVNEADPAHLLLDDQALEITQHEPDGALLRRDGDRRIEESLCSHLFRSQCPITAQPDWGSIFIRYQGPALDHAALLRYIVSFRGHQGFHEDCVERIFRDITQQCRPDWLVVGIQFTRRGGVEINPWRWSAGAPEPRIPRLARQ